MKTPKSPELYQTALDHFNDPVICNGRLARLVGYAEDEWTAITSWSPYTTFCPSGIKLV